MFAFLGAVIDARWARFGRENTRDASLLVNDFMVGVICVQILSVKETSSCTAAEVWYCERPKPTVTAADDTSGSWGKPLASLGHSVSRVKETGVRVHNLVGTMAHSLTVWNDWYSAGA